MSIADLQNVPETEQEFLRWAWAHRVEHEKVWQRVQDLGGPNLVRYQLEPINVEDMRRWLEWHQRAHLDMTFVTAVQSVDLETVDFQDTAQREAWTSLHYQEHYDVAAALLL